jgi:hypothetical protein
VAATHGDRCGGELQYNCVHCCSVPQEKLGNTELKESVIKRSLQDHLWGLPEKPKRNRKKLVILLW